MANYFEIDFLGVETKKSGDAIPLRYERDGETSIHVVDGGFQDTGESVVDHIRQHYGNPRRIDRVIVTHPDRDHAGGLRAVLNEFEVGELWMLRPWIYAEEIIDRFTNYTSVDRLAAHLKSVYSNLAALEEIALEKAIPIYEPFQGAKIGIWTVLAPKKARYLDLIVQSDRTPESTDETRESTISAVGQTVAHAVAAVVNYIRSKWGDEVFSPSETSAENEMSVIQFARLNEKDIVLTGDAGRGALAEAADFAHIAGLHLPGVDYFQVPHHGSRRNVNAEVLDRWLGAPYATQGESTGHFIAMISSALEDTDHPRKSVKRAMIHRGGKVFETEGKSIRFYIDAPYRPGWSAATPADYPSDQEE